MAAPGYETDPADREFDRLLEETGHAVCRSATAAPVSDAAFESLLTAFKSLNVPDAARDPRGKTGRHATPAAIQAAAEDVTRAWQAFVPHLPASVDPALRHATRDMQRAVVGLQLARHAGSAHAVLAASVACQPLALALDQVIEVLDPRQARVERNDMQASVITGPERMPLHFIRHWLTQDTTEASIAEDAWIVIAMLGMHRIGFVVDSVEGVVPASRQAPGVLLRGMHGIAAVAVAGQRLLPLLDLTMLLNVDKRGG